MLHMLPVTASQPAEDWSPALRPRQEDLLHIRRLHGGEWRERAHQPWTASVLQLRVRRAPQSAFKMDEEVQRKLGSGAWLRKAAWSATEPCIAPAAAGCPPAAAMMQCPCNTVAHLRQHGGVPGGHVVQAVGHAVIPAWPFRVAQRLCGCGSWRAAAGLGRKA